MKRISFSEANRDFQTVLDTVNYNDAPIIIVRQNDNDAVIISLTYYNGLLETLYLLKSPSNSSHLSESIQQYRTGQVTVHGLKNKT